MGAHKGYNTFRCALELLEATGHADAIAEIERGGDEDGVVGGGDGGDGDASGPTALSLQSGSSAASLEEVAELRARLDEKDAQIAALEGTLEVALKELARIASIVDARGSK